MVVPLYSQWICFRIMGYQNLWVLKSLTERFVSANAESWIWRTKYTAKLFSRVVVPIDTATYMHESSSRTICFHWHQSRNLYDFTLCSQGLHTSETRQRTVLSRVWASLSEEGRKLQILTQEWRALYTKHLGDIRKLNLLRKNKGGAAKSLDEFEEHEQIRKNIRQ